MSLTDCRILVTGANGFIGKNLVTRLQEMQTVTVRAFVRGDDASLLPSLVSEVDAVVHLAGENRPEDEDAFTEVNSHLTEAVCHAIRGELSSTGRHIPLILASSTQAELDNPYGRSKLEAESAVKALSAETNNPSVIFRLPGVFGKWCRPNYNSVVATFCHNIARGLPIAIRDAEISLKLVYVDDVVQALISSLCAPEGGLIDAKVEPEYEVTLGQLSEQIKAFGSCRTDLVTERVGTGLTRALYATYVSYLPQEKFSYPVTQYADSRGVFVEMLKTPDCGQFSYFTAHPGVTRGGHYHHTKTEKFLVIKGRAHFRFRNLLTKELVELQTDGCHPQVVDTVPGWIHDITNIGDEEMVVMLWANENFDRDKPDTIAGEI